MQCIRHATTACAGLIASRSFRLSGSQFLGEALRKSARSAGMAIRRPKIRAASSTANALTPGLNTNAINGVAAAKNQRVYVQYHVYKGKSALCIEPIKPKFREVEGGSLVMHKEGTLLLQFAHAVGTREYDWSNKKIFALSVSEMGTILSTGPTDAAEFFHDPNKGRQGEGTVTKTLKLTPMKDGLFVTISVRDQGVEDKINVPITRAEYAIIRNTISYFMPHLMGWHSLLDPSSIDNAMLADGNSQDTQVDL